MATSVIGLFKIIRAKAVATAKRDIKALLDAAKKSKAFEEAIRKRAVAMLVASQVKIMAADKAAPPAPPVPDASPVAVPKKTPTTPVTPLALADVADATSAMAERATELAHECLESLRAKAALLDPDAGGLASCSWGSEYTFDGDFSLAEAAAAAAPGEAATLDAGDVSGPAAVEYPATLHLSLRPDAPADAGVHADQAPAGTGFHQESEEEDAAGEDASMSDLVSSFMNLDTPGNSQPFTQPPTQDEDPEEEAEEVVKEDEGEAARKVGKKVKKARRSGPRLSKKKKVTPAPAPASAPAPAPAPAPTAELGKRTRTRSSWLADTVA